MRIAFYGLLFANLVLFAWSQWHSPPAPAPAPAQPASTTAARPGGPAGGAVRILLAGERPAPVRTAATADGAADSTPDAAARLDGSSAGAAAGAASVVAELRRCVSMGPFTGVETAAQVTAMLKQDGYEPRQRPATGPVLDNYMVVVGQLKGEADQARVIRRLKRGGLDDAFALPKLDDGYAVSVGLFSQAQRAERRVLAVERMGLKSTIVERTRPGTVYWLDFDMQTPAAGDADTLDSLLKTSDPSQKWQVTPCPEPQPVG